MATLIHRLSRSRIDYRQIYRIGRSLASESATIHGKLVYPPFQVRSVLVPAGSVTGFNDMITGNQRKFYLLGGKGGVGKTSCAASLAVKFANNGHPTIVVSTDPAHSLSDSFAQDLTGGTLVPVQGVDSPLFALELNPENAKEEFRTAQKAGGGNGVKDLMDSMGLGMLSDQVRNVLSVQLGDLKLGELLDTPPPGMDEAIAMSKACKSCVLQFAESPEYSKFTRIVFDTAPTMKKKLASATSALKSVFGKGGGQQEEHTSDKLDKLRESMHKVRDLFRDADSTEFIIVTIPTVMAVSESSRLHGSLKKESVPVHRLIVNQCLPPSATSDCKFCAMRRKDQTRALDMIEKDPGLGSLKLIKAPLFDAEIRGVPALKFMGDTVWK
ncbi:ATPase GET3B [Linum perenne]